MIEFTLEELQHMNWMLQDPDAVNCESCNSARKKIREEIERILNPPLNENGCIEKPVPEKYKALGVSRWELQPGRRPECEEESKTITEKCNEPDGPARGHSCETSDGMEGRKNKDGNGQSTTLSEYV